MLDSRGLVEGVISRRTTISRVLAVAAADAKAFLVSNGVQVEEDDRAPDRGRRKKPIKKTGYVWRRTLNQLSEFLRLGLVSVGAKPAPAVVILPISEARGGVGCR